MYVAQVRPQIDEAGAEKNPFRTETIYMDTTTCHVYILECCDKTLYTGCTKNIEKRIYEHNNTGAGARYTRGRRPVKLVYIESYPTLSDALKREAQIKKLSKAQKLLLIQNGSDSANI